ncbi:MAG: ferredoxin [Paracoccaceae bacterium]
MRDQIEALAEAAGLFIAGEVAEDGGTVVLLAAGAGFWPLLQAAPEFAGADPVDLYSTRIVNDMAGRLGAEAIFPFGGPPYAPFIRWAQESGRAWQSPVGMLIHDTAGLMISYRGALRFQEVLEPAGTLPSMPCTICAGQPCLGACPVDALSKESGYDVAACHAYLDTPDGTSCLTQGCVARRACPVSHQFGRDPAQSAHHMASFHPKKAEHA